jgi:hypothetical protein
VIHFSTVVRAARRRALAAVAALALVIPAPAAAQTELTGRVVRGGAGVPGTPVELHRVSRDASGQLAEATTGPDGAFRFTLPAPAEGAFNVYFATATVDGVRYFGPALHGGEEEQGYTVQAYDTTSTRGSGGGAAHRAARRDPGGGDAGRVGGRRGGAGGEPARPHGDRPRRDAGLRLRRPRRGVGPPDRGADAGRGGRRGAAAGPGADGRAGARHGAAHPRRARLLLPLSPSGQHRRDGASARHAGGHADGVRARAGPRRPRHGARPRRPLRGRRRALRPLRRHRPPPRRHRAGELERPRRLAGGPAPRGRRAGAAGAGRRDALRGTRRATGG